MPNNKPQLKTYTELWIKDKFSYISEQERRTDSKQLEYIILKYIKEYEAKHGELIVGEDGSIIVTKPKEVAKDKSSNSKTG